VAEAFCRVRRGRACGPLAAFGGGGFGEAPGEPGPPLRQDWGGQQDWGGRKIRRVLQRDVDAVSAVPAAITTTGILYRGSLLERETPAPEPFKRFATEAPNLLWQMAFKGHFALARMGFGGRTDGKGERCFPLTLQAVNRAGRSFALAARGAGLPDACEATVRERLTRVFEA
jgi:hypothetical protein